MFILSNYLDKYIKYFSRGMHLWQGEAYVETVENLNGRSHT